MQDLLANQPEAPDPAPGDGGGEEKKS
jgi:hypothetical protein